jgi:hypothetical protein
MRSLSLALLFGALVAFTGCSNSTPGGSGTTNKERGPIVGQKDDTFTITMPTFGVTVKQGGEKDVEFDIKRGKNFEEDVTLKFEKLPEGVTADPAAPTIKKGEDKVKVAFKAADNAALGKATVHVVGHPSKGSDFEGKFDLTVEKKPEEKKPEEKKPEK